VPRRSGTLAAPGVPRSIWRVDDSRAHSPGRIGPPLGPARRARRTINVASPRCEAVLVRKLIGRSGLCGRYVGLWRGNEFGRAEPPAGRWTFGAVLIETPRTKQWAVNRQRQCETTHQRPDERIA